MQQIYCWETQIGGLNIYLASTKKGAFRIELTLGRQCDCIEFFKELFPNARLFKEYHYNRYLGQVVKAILHNEPAKRTIDFDFTCTPFQWIVFKAITRIPFGETRSYGELASMIGMPKSARAVGQALSKNPLPLIFP